MKFLVPTDFSEGAKSANRFAAELARTANCNLELIHVVEPFAGEPAFIAVDILDVQEDALRQLNEERESLQKEFNIECSVIVKIGELTQEVITTAAKNKVELIVMGTSGASGLNKFLLGSNTVFVIEQSAVPVLAIRQDIVYSKPERIVYATDNNESDIDDLNALAFLAAPLNAEIIVVHIDERVEETGRNPENIYFSDLMKKKVLYSKISCRNTQHTSTVDGIKSILQEEGADILALSMRKRNIFQKLFSKSVTKEFVFDINIPILVFHIKRRLK